MFFVDRLILVAGILLVVGIASSRLSSRVGLPVLVLFLIVGMLAGSEGVGGIAFENYGVAHGVGTVALAVILFDGGLRTDLATFRIALAPALTLSTVGVLVTAGVVAGAAIFLFDLPLLPALLLGSIVSSTDAAAVFAVFRARGTRVRQRIAATLEIESGSNDPMAVFLTIACLELILGRLDLGLGVPLLFLRQMVFGAVVGYIVGWTVSRAVERVQLDAAGLYPVLSGASAFVAYGAAASLGGSGFLAVYVAGTIVGNRRLPFQRGIRLFHDGLAWLAQIAMFVLLGLLSFPSRLLAVAGPAVLLALALMFVARPLAVWVCLAGFRFSNREMAFIAWGGLKGAVPIVLATYPLLLGVEGTDTLFDVVFFVALVSAATQGWTLPAAARLLRLSLPPAPEPPVTLEITSLRSVDSDIIEYTLGPRSRAAGRRIRQLALPEGAVIAMVVRGHDVMPPRGSTALSAHDHVFVLVRPGLRRFLDRVFAEGEAGGASAAVMDLTEFPLRGATRVSDLQEFYGVTLDASEELTLDELLRARVGDGLAEGATLQLGTIELRVREIVDGQVETVGLRVVVDDEIT